MAKRQLVETRNGCDIYLMTEQLSKAAGGMQLKTYKVMKGRRMCGERIPTLREAREIADAQPPPKT